MRNVIENLSRQHRELVRAATRMFGWLDPSRLQGHAAEAHQCLSTLTGILRVHLSMEDRSFYPSLLGHRDEALREMARTFLDERADLERRYEGYRDAWPNAAAIAGAPERFADETRQILGMLWQRMHDEDDRFHPEIIARWRET